MRYIALLVGLWVCFAALAAEQAHLGRNIDEWPNTESRKTSNGFAAWLVATPDKDWREKWDTPPDTIPHFSEAASLKVGQQLNVLTFFANPMMDANHQATVTCSLKVTRPDSSVSADQSNIPCLMGELKGNPRNIRMSPAVIQFTGDESDLLGEYTVTVEVSDQLRGTVLHLEKKFTLEAK